MDGQGRELRSWRGSVRMNTIQGPLGPCALSSSEGAGLGACEGSLVERREVPASYTFLPEEGTGNALVS